VAFDLRQSLKLTQNLLMTPQLQQAIKLLQLSRLELEQFVSQELAENPILEEGALENSEETIQEEREAEATEEQALNQQMDRATDLVDKVSSDERNEMDWEAFSRMQEMAIPAPSTAKNMDEAPNYENIVTRGKTLQEYLMGQIGEMDMSPDEKQIASVITGNIDERGYLAMPLEELATQEKFDLELAEDILDVVQRLDPPGVGARDLKECLLLQIRNSHMRNGIVEKIIDCHLPELENRNYNAIAKAMKVTLEEVLKNVAIIGELEPVPGRQFGGETPQVIIPDVYVFKLGEDWVVTLNEEGLPRLRLNSTYKDMISKKEAKGDDKNYIQEKMKSASWLIKSIQQRQRTIFKVTESIVARQKDFFERGVEYLKPMILKDIAEDISMHESTVSRVTNNKYVHTPRGIFELKYFFNSAVSRTDGDDVASESVKRMISEIVKTEDVKDPYSDQKIVELLTERGIQLARRTVAKYREQLGILPSSKRKKYF